MIDYLIMAVKWKFFLSLAGVLRTQFGGGAEGAAPGDPPVPPVAVDPSWQHQGTCRLRGEPWLREGPASPQPSNGASGVNLVIRLVYAHGGDKPEALLTSMTTR